MENERHTEPWAHSPKSMKAVPHCYVSTPWHGGGGVGGVGGGGKGMEEVEGVAGFRLSL